MTLLENLVEITSRWRGVFPQRRSHRPAPGARFAGLPGTSHPLAHHLDQRRLPAQLERGVFPAFALPVAAATVVSAHCGKRIGVVPGTAGRRRRR